MSPHNSEVLIIAHTIRGANDDRQQEAEDLMQVLPLNGLFSLFLTNLSHELFRAVLDGKLYEAPIGKNPQVCCHLSGHILIY